MPKYIIDLSLDGYANEKEEEEACSDGMEEALRDSCFHVSSIQQVNNLEEVSDGYHTFKELYEHRHALFLALMKSNPEESWFSVCHEDGTFPFVNASEPEPKWFIAGMVLPELGQISYHLPISYWLDARATGAMCLPVAKKWDGHTPQQVVERLMGWIHD